MIPKRYNAGDKPMDLWKVFLYCKTFPEELFYWLETYLPFIVSCCRDFPLTTVSGPPCWGFLVFQMRIKIGVPFQCLFHLFWYQIEKIHGGWQIYPFTRTKIILWKIGLQGFARCCWTNPLYFHNIYTWGHLKMCSWQWKLVKATIFSSFKKIYWFKYGQKLPEQKSCAEKFGLQGFARCCWTNPLYFHNIYTWGHLKMCSWQ